MRKKIILSLAAVFYLGAFSSAFASPITFFGQDNTYKGITNSDIAENNFLSTLGVGNYATEDFEGFALGSTGITISFGGFGNATLSGDGSIKNIDDPLIGRWATSPTQYWDTSTVFTINFSLPTFAFGFHATDLGDGAIPGQLVLTYNYVDGSGSNVINVDNPPAVSGNGLYFGFYENDLSKGFNSISFVGATNLDYFGFDDMTVGLYHDPAPIPEPATMLLLGAGLASLAGIRYRRKKQ